MITVQIEFDRQLDRKTNCETKLGSPRMNRTLNFRYLIRILVIFAVVAGAIYLFHRRQAGRQAQAFLHQADTAEQGGDFARTAGYLRRFLALRPSDTDARARL